MKICKDDFFTIPCAPNYEINGRFKVRNKKTGRFLHTYKSTDKKKRRKYRVATIMRNHKPITRSLKGLYAQAVSAASPEKFYPINSLDNLYETDFWGNVRNARTKKFLKPALSSGRVFYHVKANGKNLMRSKDEVLLELFDVAYSPKWRKIPVQLSKERQAWRFNSITEAAKFLAPRVFFSADYLRCILGRRQPEVFGYKVAYLG